MSFSFQHYKWEKKTDEVSPWPIQNEPGELPSRAYLKQLCWIGRAFESFDENHRLALSHVGGYEVSTVFLGINHRFFGEGEPILFETMIFGLGSDDFFQRRYTTPALARKGHASISSLVRSLQKAPMVSRRNLSRVLGQL